MGKRLLYLDDLYDFFFNEYQQNVKFNANEFGSPIVVNVHGKVNFEQASKDTEGLYPVHLQACHTGLNVNTTNISYDVMEQNLNSFKNRPILGYIHKVNDQYEFYSHNLHTEDGELVYDERPIGIIPESCNAQLIYDKDKKKIYCEVNGYIFEEYSHAVEILEREQECPVSVELSIRSLSYNAKEKYLDIEDFFFNGVTILGKTPDGKTVNPGMEGSNIKLADFSKKETVDYSEQLAEMQTRLNQLESMYFNGNQHDKKGGSLQLDKFNELLTKYNKVQEDITFEYEGLSDEELEAKFEEVFGEVKEESKVMKKEISFELSHDDIRYALYTLLDEYEEQDDTWYYINEVFDSYFVFSGYNGYTYGQKYTKTDDVVRFEGDRYKVYSVYVTESEYEELKTMRSNYEELVTFKANTEKKEELDKKNVILNDEQYSVISEKDENGKYTNEAFAALVENIDSYSVSDLEKEMKVVLADYYTAHSKFASNKEIKKTVVVKPEKVQKNNRYGSLKF